MIMFGSLANTDKPHVYLSILALISFIVYFLKYSVLLDKLFIPCYASKHTILFYYDNLLFYDLWSCLLTILRIPLYYTLLLVLVKLSINLHLHLVLIYDF